jgi:hypothetical protein
MNRFLAAAIVLLAAAGSARADWPAFREISFPAGKRIMDRIHIDLDGDGAKDLLLVRGREVSVYLQKNGEFHPDAPDQKFNFVDSAILWDDGDVDFDGKPEILFLTAEGVRYYKWQAGRLSFVPNVLLDATGATILKVASRDEIRHKDFHADVDGDQVPDLMIPGDGCFLLFRGKRAGGFGPAETLALRPEVYLDAGGESPTSQAYSSYWYPQPFSGDFDGDGRRDIFVHQRQRISVFLWKAEGGYGPQPSMMLPLEFEGPLDEGRFKLDFQLPTKFADIDNDGLTDIVATHIGRATTYIFKGRKDRKDLAKPDVILKMKGISFLDFLVDLDGDGRKDLMIARTDRPGLWDIVKVLVTKEIPVEALFFYAKGDGTLYGRNPDERRDIQIPLLFSSAKRGINVGTSAVISLLGDMTGDGVNDLILRASEDRIAVYAGKKGGRGFSEDPDFKLKVHDMDGYRFLEPVPDDLNGDGIADLSLAYYSWDGKADRLSILLSPGKPTPAAPAAPPKAPAPPPDKGS